jgi:hypothetical protein
MENNIPASINEFVNYVEKLTDNELFNWATACNKVREVGVFDCNTIYGQVSLKIRANSMKNPYYIIFDMCTIVADELMSRFVNFRFKRDFYVNLYDLYNPEDI